MLKFETQYTDRGMQESLYHSGLSLICQSVKDSEISTVD